MAKCEKNFFLLSSRKIYQNVIFYLLYMAFFIYCSLVGNLHGIFYCQIFIYCSLVRNLQSWHRVKKRDITSITALRNNYKG